MGKKRPFSKLTTATNSLNQQVDFVRAYAKDSHGHPYHEVHADNFMQILAGKEQWNQITDDQKLIINGILLAGEGKSYDELLSSALVLKMKTDDFIQTYLIDFGAYSTFEVDAQHYELILSGKREWSILPMDLKKIINAVLISYCGKGFEELCKDAEDLKNAIEQFLQTYVCDKNGIVYDMVDSKNYRNILAAQQDWQGLSPKVKDGINQVWEQLDFDQLLNMALMLDRTSKSFVKVYLSEKDGTLYQEVTIHNYEQLLSGWNYWKKLSKDQRILIDEILQAEDVKIYEDQIMDAREFERMFKAFVQCYVGNATGEIWTEVTTENYAQILAGEQAWEEMNPEEQEAVNRILMRHCGRDFDMFLNQAKAFQKNVMDFLQSYSQKQTMKQKEMNTPLEETIPTQEEVKSMEKAMQKQIEQAKILHKTTIPHGGIGADQSISYKNGKSDGKVMKGPVAVCGMLSIAAIALLGKKKKK